MANALHNLLAIMDGQPGASALEGPTGIAFRRPQDPASVESPWLLPTSGKGRQISAFAQLMERKHQSQPPEEGGEDAAQESTSIQDAGAMVCPLAQPVNGPVDLENLASVSLLFQSGAVENQASVEVVAAVPSLPEADAAPTAWFRPSGPAGIPLAEELAPEHPDAQPLKAAIALSDAAPSVALTSRLPQPVTAEGTDLTLVAPKPIVSPQPPRPLAEEADATGRSLEPRQDAGAATRAVGAPGTFVPGVPQTLVTDALEGVLPAPGKAVASPREQTAEPQHGAQAEAASPQQAPVRPTSEAPSDAAVLADSPLVSVFAAEAAPQPSIEQAPPAPYAPVTPRQAHELQARRMPTLGIGSTRRGGEETTVGLQNPPANVVGGKAAEPSAKIILAAPGQILQLAGTEQTTAAFKADAPRTAEATAATSGQQIAEALRDRPVQAGQQIVIRLDPPELGQIQLVFRDDGQDVHGILQVANPRTLAQLRHETPALIDRLAESGITLRTLDIEPAKQSAGGGTDFSLFHDQQPRQQEMPQASFASVRLVGDGATAGEPEIASLPTITAESINVWA